MAKVKCPNGHVFDTNIYGNQCPLCQSVVGTSSPAQGAPAGMARQAAPTPPPIPGTGAPAAAMGVAAPGMGNATNMGAPSGGMGAPAQSNSPHTRIGGMAAGPASPATSPSSAPAQGMGGTRGMGGMANPTGPTKMNRGGEVTGLQGMQQPQVGGGNKTTIRRPDAQGRMVEGRKLVGFLVCYNRFPNGKAFNIYEGRNYVGRDPKCDICVPDDNQMSSRHMSILYRSVDNKFKFRDEQSSNGTFVNKNLLDDGELENYDIIRVGSTLFIFIAIPNVF